MSPSLATIGSGLFQTHVDWKDIKLCIQKERNIAIQFGPNKSARQIGSGNGFMSRIGVIDADFQSAETGLPARFLLKIPSFLETIEMEESVAEEEGVSIMELLEGFEKDAKMCHNREIAVYRAFSRFDSSLTKLPQYYFGQQFAEENKLKGFIAMEYVDNAVTRHFYHKVTPEQLMDVLRAVAFLEAKSFQLKDEEKQKLESNPIKTIYSRFITPNVVSKAFRDMCAVYKELKPSAEELLEMVEEMLDLDLPSTLNEELGMKDVFVHGDLWSANLLWTKTTDGVVFSKYIDHQQAHFGCPAEDLCRLFISTMSGADRRANWERLLEEFHGYIVEYSEGELPFTLEQVSVMTCC
ncbi:hypothetical protein OESDEN_02343 [Oesophagostomum dentatum]|uniref:CHK kinase-like domain-containing protein n=1 Tax=Oesophagostomum dentatum TaxID=61180 RepID=A0A0B1TJH3_OESDE|nr:hypothetical protein OESDEN_02343 [Oesophagostomum dentatum]